MQLLTFLYPTLLALLLTPSPISAAAPKKVPKNAILLSNVKTLTLRENAKTSHRRVSAIPQLTCKGPACAHHHIDIMRCTNAGADYNTEDIQWSCSASLPADFKLGSTDVICEGYSSPDDDYVLKGSCGVEYRLLYTEAGEEKYGGGGWFGGGGKGKGGEGEGWTIDGIIFTVLFVAVLVWICWALYAGVRDAPAPGAGRAPRRGGGGGWGGGGGDDPYDPPPPYPGKRYGATEQQQGWRPGFWSGSAAGAAAGYMAGRAGNQRQPDAQQGGGWFGGGGGRNSGGGSGWGGAGPSRSGSSSSSSARHESTGFGSTSRR